MDSAATCDAEYTLERVLYMAIELDDNRWMLGFSTGLGQRPRQRNIATRDTTALEKEIQSAKRRFRLPEDARVLSCYEAGREGFWLHRYLIHTGVGNVVVDAGSLEARKKRRRVKTDRVDLEKLLRMLIRFHAGDRDVWSVVRVPGTGVEDRRQLHRDRWALSTERTRHINRIKGLLATQGVSLPVNGDFPAQLDKARTWDGSPLAPGLARRLLREHERLQLVDQQVKAIEQEQRQTLRTSQHPTFTMIRDLMRLKSIHIQTAWPFVMELYSWREFQNGKEIGAIVGLEPVPYQSGGMSRERGLSKCGNARLRSLAVEFAWQWLFHQPNSELSQWFEERFGRRGRRVRKIGIVALARKLLVALWRYLETGEIPKGATLKAVVV